MTPAELQEQLDIEEVPLGPDELQKEIDTEKIALGPDELQTEIDAEKTVAKTEERSFMVKHPNLYGIYGSAVGIAEALGKFGFPKYADPYEVKKFAKLSPKEQRYQLLVDTAETIGLVGAQALWAKLGLAAEAYLPKAAYKFFTKPRGIGAKVPLPKVEVSKAEPKKSPVLKKILGEEPTPVEKVTQALKEAKPIRKAQEQIYSKERGERLGRAIAAGEKVTGEERSFAMLKKLKGELTKVEFESLRGKIGQKDIDELFEMIWKSPDILGYENVSTFRGLGKLLGEFGGQVPQPKELELLRRVFPDEFIQALIKKRPLFQQMKEAALQLANIPRSIMASYDLSAPFRQGLFLGPSHPKRFTQSFIKMFRQFGSEKAYAAVQESIRQKSTYSLMKESGLALTELAGRMGAREEAFVSQWAEKIPLIGRGVRAAGRAHTGFLNKLRADVFEDLVLKAERFGLDPRKNMDLTKKIAKFCNLASGRGSLGSLETSAVALNTFFFSPRLMSSRLTLLNPVYYIKAEPFVRKEALKSLFALAGATGTTLGMAKAAGLEVGLDYRSADFLKIKIGNTRIDVLGGFQQYIRATGQIVSGEYVSSTTGKVVTLGEGYRPLTRYEIALRQIESKEAPIFSFITTLMKGQTFEGEDPEVLKEVGKRFIPMALSDIYEIAEENPELLPISWLGIFGVGLQTYKAKPGAKKGIRALPGGFGPLEGF